VIALVVRAESRQARDDVEGAKQALEKATELAPQLAVAHLQLGVLYEQAGDVRRALPRYERVVELQPNNVIALNNLAFNIAVHDKAPARAKPYAERALKLVPRDPAVSDTLAWIEYLLGNYAAAARLTATAVKGAPDNADIRLHAAFIYAANQSQASALTELDAALKLNPELAGREDVKELQKTLRPPSSGAGAQ
jgi:Flp pilus assembly protein TadD